MTAAVFGPLATVHTGGTYMHMEANIHPKWEKKILSGLHLTVGVTLGSKDLFTTLLNCHPTKGGKGILFIALGSLYEEEALRMTCPFAMLSKPCASSRQRQVQLGWCVPQGGRGRNFRCSRSAEFKVIQVQV